MKKKLLIVLVFVVLILPVVVAGADAVRVTAEVDKEDYVIGDRVNVTVRAENTKGMEVRFPEKPENLGDFSFIDSDPVPKKRFGRKEEGVVYVLGIYSTGTHVVFPVQVKYKRPDEADWHTAQSPQIAVEVESLLSPDEELGFGAGFTKSLFSGTVEVPFVASAETSVSIQDENPHAICASRTQQWVPLGCRRQAADRLAENRIERADVGPRLLEASLHPGNLGHGNGIHRPGDLPDILDVANPTLDRSYILCHRTSTWRLV